MTFGEELILRTKLQPPRLRRWTLARTRLLERLEQGSDYRLTALVAPTGYGKSTLLAGWLADSNHPYAWYSLGQLDADPFIFLLHLIYAFRSRFAGLGDRAMEVLEREWHEAGNPAERRAAARPALHLFINELCDTLKEDTFLVLDDFHLLESQRDVVTVAEELISAAPPILHIVVASRQRPAFELLPRWQVQQEVLSIDKESLAFTPAETCQLFEECYGYSLGEKQAIRLSTETEGWIIALQMIWQNLQSVPGPGLRGSSPELQPGTPNSELGTLDAMLDDLPRNMANLFDYLAQEVLNRQEPETQRFLLASSVLRRMTGSVCDFVLESPAGESEPTLRRLSEAGLFIIVQGDDQARSYRYHHLFGEFLYSRLSATPERARHLHQQAALYHEQHDQPEDALHHRLAARDWTNAARLLETGLGQRLIETGRLERLEHWLNTFPVNDLAANPALLLLQGDCLRLTSRFEPALYSYRQAATGYEAKGDKAGLARAYRGRALVYLDTVQPAAAEEWLERALEAVETTGNKVLHAALLRDLAENKLNRGRPLEAEELHHQAQTLLGELDHNRPIDVRILLRSGRIHEAIEFLEQIELGVGGRGLSTTLPQFQTDTGTRNPELETRNLSSSNSHRRAGRSHREGLLVLSLLYASRGEGEQAITCAEQGIFLARELRAPFTEAVAWQRLGHALTVNGQTGKAQEAYMQGQAMGDKLQVRRLRAEGLMGRCLLYGRYPDGNLADARRASEEALQVARQAGDEWIEGFLQVSLAAALIEHGEYAEATGVAQIAQALLENCGDRFGLTLARLWAALAGGNLAELGAACQQCERNGYGFLLERPTLFGPKGVALFKKIDQARQNDKTFNGAKNHPAETINLPDLNGSSPFTLPASSFTLRVTTLGGFAVGRPDGTELGPRDWQREKARQLFQLLLTRRSKPLPKEQILEYLWPESDSSGADARFKVVLNALVRALEPERSSRAQSTYIIRSGSGTSLSYGIVADAAHIWLDASEFEQLATQGAHAEISSANNEQAAATALELYSRALELYRGDFLPGCLYEDWAAPERERLLALFLTTAERLTRLLAAAGEWERCLEVCRQILARDNCWEEAYRLMMLAFWKLGNRAAALRAYEKCATALSEELSVEPMPQTLKLYQEILKE